MSEDLPSVTPKSEKSKMLDQSSNVWVDEEQHCEIKPLEAPGQWIKSDQRGP